MSDDELLLSVMRKIITERRDVGFMGCEGPIESVYFDTGWIDVTREEADALQRAIDEQNGDRVSDDRTAERNAN